MNDVRSEVMDRLLEAELATVFDRTPRKALRPARAWLIAALVLLGAAVATGTWLLQRHPPEQAQEPDPLPLPEAKYTKNIAQLEDQPDDLLNLVCAMGEPADLARLQRFTELRRLALLVANIKVGNVRWGSHRSWDQPKDDLLAGVAALPKLESLHLPRELVLRPELLAVLQRTKTLRELALIGKHVVVDAALIAALAALPLRRLALVVVDLDGAKARLLATLPLSELKLFHCPGLDRSVLAALSASPSLQRLELQGLGRPPMIAGAKAFAMWTPEAKELQCLATMPALRELSFDSCTLSTAAFGTMPRLRELTLQGCTVGDATLAGLPEQLTRLDLYACSGFTAAGLGHLQRLRDLRQLRFRERMSHGFIAGHGIELRAAAAELSELLGLLRLQSFDFTGMATEQLLRAVALQPELTTLTLCEELEQETPTPADFSLLATAPRLETLRLFNLSRLEPGDLKPLASCRPLRRLELICCARCPEADVRKVLPALIVQVTGMPAQRK